MKKLQAYKSDSGTLFATKGEAGADDIHLMTSRATDEDDPSFIQFLLMVGRDQSFRHALVRVIQEIDAAEEP
jgi:hypothetical protein